MKYIYTAINEDNNLYIKGINERDIIDIMRSIDGPAALLQDDVLKVYQGSKFNISIVDNVIQYNYDVETIAKTGITTIYQINL